MNSANHDTHNIGSVLFYQRLEPLDRVVHEDLGVTLAEHPYAFLAGTHAVPLTADEFVHAATCYPIVFAKETRTPLALMGPRAGVNVFLAEDGAMDPEAYVPAFVRRYPFLPVDADGSQDLLGGGERLLLCIDREAPTVTKKPEIPFFTNGQHSKYTKEAIDICKEFEKLGRRTKEFIRVVDEYDLFESMELTVPRADADGKEMAPETVDECLRISETKLNALPTDDYMKLRDMGIPFLAYAHLLSLSLWSKLLSRAARIDADR